jgi:hypothetical protein
VSLPGADELFRTTGGAALQAPQPRQHTNGEAQPAGQGDARLRPVPEGDEEDRQEGEAEARTAGAAEPDSAEHGGRDQPPGPRRPFIGERAGERAAERGGERPGERPGERTGERAGVQSAATAAPTVTVTSQVPSVQPVPPVQHVQKPVPPPITATPQPQAPARRKASRQNRRPSGRERHDEKITVYVSAEELMDLEHARLVLRGEHGLAIDRGRIVREAVAVVLADLESRGDASILVRRLRGR